MDELGGMLLLSKEKAGRGRQQQAGTQQALSQLSPSQRGSLKGEAVGRQVGQVSVSRSPLLGAVTREVTPELCHLIIFFARSGLQINKDDKSLHPSCSPS